MRVYQMDIKAIEAFYNINTNVGLSGNQNLKKRSVKDVFRFLYGILKVLQAKLSFVFFISTAAFVISGVFSYLNGSWGLFWLSMVSFLIGFTVLLAECVILYCYKQTYYSRIDSKRENVYVLRNGQRTEVAADELAAGDVLFLEPGVVLRGDARIFEADNLYVDEKLIFGSTIPSLKSSAPIKNDHVSAEQQANMVWKGSYISSGSGRAIVTALDEDCYLAKTGGRKDRSQHSVYYTKQNNISRIVTYAYLILVLIVLLVGVLFGESKTEAFLVIAVLSSLITLNPMAYITEWSYYRAAQKLSKEGVLIRNIEAFDGMNSEKQIYFDADDLLDQRLKFIETINLTGDNKSTLSYFSLCMGDGYFSNAVAPALAEYDLSFDVLNQKYPVFRRERDQSGNWYSLFSKNGSSVVVASGHWKLMLPLLNGLNDELKERIDELERQGKFVCAMASESMDFIPSKLDVASFAGEMSLIALLVFDVNVDENIRLVIERFKKLGTDVLLYSQYSDLFNEQLSALYGADLAEPLAKKICGFSDPQYKGFGPAVYESAPQNVKEQAAVVLKNSIKPQPVIYRVKCMFCGLRRCLNFLSIVGIATVFAAMMHLLQGFDLQKLVYPLLPLPICLLLPCYYLMETTRNCAQYNRSYFLGLFCAFSTIVTICLQCETSILSLCLSFLILSVYLMISAYRYRKVTEKDVISLILFLVVVLLPWIVLGTGDWLTSVVLAVFPAIGAFLLDLLY